MRRIIEATLLVFLASLVNGCRTPYMIDRARDAKDIFTATVGRGGGAFARVGPVHAGLYYGYDLYGLRGGELLRPQELHEESETFDPLIAFPNLGGGPWLYWEDTFGFYEQDSPRGKHYYAEGICPFISLPGMGPMHRESARLLGSPVRCHPIHYLTQCEVAAGLWGTVRIGFNPGELLDFILGWTTVDIFDDDIEAKHR